MRQKRTLKRKLHSNSGETIAETLVTMIILSLAVLMLAGAVVTAARVNKKADNTDVAFVAGQEIGGSGTNSPEITISEKTGTGTDKNTNKKYYYYDYSK